MNHKSGDSESRPDWCVRNTRRVLCCTSHGLCWLVIVATRNTPKNSRAYRELQQRFTRNLRQIRQDMGLTQQEVAERCGWVMQHIQQLEDPRKTNPKLITVARLSHGLKIDASRFFVP